MKLLLKIIIGLLIVSIQACNKTPEKKQKNPIVKKQEVNLLHKEVCSTSALPIKFTVEKEQKQTKTDKKSDAKVQNIDAKISTNNLAKIWNENFIRKFLSTLSSKTLSPRSEKMAINILIRKATNQQIRIPTNMLDFVATIVEFPATNTETLSWIHEVVYNVTNELVNDYFISAYISNLIKKSSIPYENMQKRWIVDKRVSIITRTIGRIGTPELIDKFNKTRDELRKQSEELSDAIGRGNWSFLPERFPEEAQEWLKNYPDIYVRAGLARSYLDTERPETIKVVGEFIEHLKTVPKDKQYWKDAQCTKKDTIEWFEYLWSEYGRKYKRWIEDNKQMALHRGYTDERWEKYKNLPEKEKEKIRKKYRKIIK